MDKLIKCVLFVSFRFFLYNGFGGVVDMCIIMCDIFFIGFYVILIKKKVLMDVCLF